MNIKLSVSGPALSVTNGANSLTFSPSGELAGLAGLNTVGLVKRTGTGAYSTTNVNAATDIAGILPIANGGTNSSAALSNTRLMVSSGGSIVEHSALTVSSPMRTNASGLPTTGSTDLATTDVTGILPLANGGTGSTTGSITGSGALNFTAGGTNQNLTLTPSGTGAILINSKLLSVYQGGNAKTELSLGVLGTGTSESSNINLITAGGDVANTLGSPSNKGYRLSASGNNNSGGGNKFRLNYWDGSVFTDILTMTPTLTSFATPMTTTSFQGSGYTTTGASTSIPSGQFFTIANSAGPTGVASMSIYSLSGVQNAYVGAVGGASNTPNIVFGQQTGVSSYAERMRIDTNGRLGVGTANPSTTLDVYGGMRSRVLYPSCSTGCASLVLSLDLANSFFMKVSSGSIGMNTTNASAFANYEGSEFSVTVCSASSAIPVSFGGHSSGFATGVSWTDVPPNSCTSQKFVIINNSGYYAHPVAAPFTYTP